MSGLTMEVVNMNDLTHLTELGRSLDEPAHITARQRQRALLMRATGTKAPVRTAWHQRRTVRRLALVAAGSVVAATPVLATVVVGSRSTPAYAAERLPNGTIKVTIREFRDAQGLERRLRTLGVRSVITYLPGGMRCTHRPGWYERLTDDRRPVFQLINKLDKHHAPVDYKEAIVHPDRIPAGHTAYIEVYYNPGGVDGKSRWKGEVFGMQEALASGPVDRCVSTPTPRR
jgi:hypothetical protein